MGSSAKKKKEKKKDFQKTKLKVGKTKAKASNFTDTSFKAKSIVLTKQSLSIAAPTSTEEFDHYLGLLKHKIPTQKRESLAYLTNAIGESTDNLPQPVAYIVPKLEHLICDSSNSVRVQLVKLLQALPADNIAMHYEKLLLWTQAGMTHMIGDVRSTSLDVLEWLLSVGGAELVGVRGGWVKPLKCFVSVLGWNVEDDGMSKQAGWSSTKLSKPIDDAKLLTKTLKVLTEFLRVGLTPPSLELHRKELEVEVQRLFPLTHTNFYMMPKKSNPYAYLNLFGPPPDEDGTSYEDYGDRRDLLVRRFEAHIRRGLEWVRKQQGEVGRVAKGLEDALDKGLESKKGHSDPLESFKRRQSGGEG